MIRMLQVGVLGLGLALAVGAMADDSAEPRKLTVEAVPMVQWTPPAPSSVLKPVMWMDRSDLLYRPGEYAKAFVRLNQDAYVTVLNVSADGQTTVLFPNQYVSDNRVRANAAKALWNIGWPGAEAALDEVLVDDDEAMRLSAVWVLGEVAMPDAARLLGDRLAAEASAAVREKIQQVQALLAHGGAA